LDASATEGPGSPPSGGERLGSGNEQSATPSFAGYEFHAQVRSRQHSIAHDIRRLRALLSHHPPPANQGPVSEMIQRGLQNLATTAARLRAQRMVRDGTGRSGGDDGGLAAASSAAALNAPLEDVERQLSLVTDLLQQRCSLLEVPDWHLPIDFASEAGEVHQFYSAIDAVLLDYVERTFGTEWVMAEERAGSQWLPLAFVGRQYCVHRFDHDPSRRSLHVAEVPRADLYRSRMWPLLAHELGHLLIDTLDRLSRSRSLSSADAARWNTYQLNFQHLVGVIRERVLEPISALRPELSSIPREYHDASEAWATEFVCDCIGLWVAGPAFFFSHLSVIGPDVPPGGAGRVAQSQSGPLTEWEHVQLRAGLRMLHPPTAVRQRVLRDRLWETEGTSAGRGASGAGWPIGLEPEAAELEQQAARRAEERGLDIALWKEIRGIWFGAANEVGAAAWDGARALLHRASEPYGLGQFERLREGRPPGLLPLDEAHTPADWLNIAWHKRLMYHGESMREPHRLWQALHAPDRSVGGMFGKIVVELNRHLVARWDGIRGREEDTWHER
jgi:hypothetical protein